MLINKCGVGLRKMLIVSLKTSLSPPRPPKRSPHTLFPTNPRTPFLTNKPPLPPPLAGRRGGSRAAPSLPPRRPPHRPPANAARRHHLRCRLVSGRRQTASRYGRVDQYFYLVLLLISVSFIYLSMFLIINIFIYLLFICVFIYLYL